MKKNPLLLLIVFFAIAAILAACSSSAEGRSDIPVFTRLKADNGQYEAVRRKMFNIEKTALPDKKIEINAYTTDASEQEILSFYEGALSGWTRTQRDNPGGILIARWNNGKTKGFSIYYNKSVQGGPNIVLLEQFWK